MNIIRTIVALMALFLTDAASAEIMTVQQLKDLLGRGETGQLAVAAYFQGAVDGLLAMDSLDHAETGEPYEFCKIFEARKSGTPIEHPAYKAAELVRAWEREGYSMTVPAVDMVLSYLSSHYSCGSRSSDGPSS